MKAKCMVTDRFKPLMVNINSERISVIKFPKSALMLWWPSANHDPRENLIVVPLWKLFRLKPEFPCHSHFVSISLQRGNIQDDLMDLESWGVYLLIPRFALPVSHLTLLQFLSSLHRCLLPYSFVLWLIFPFCINEVLCSFSSNRQVDSFVTSFFFFNLIGPSKKKNQWKLLILLSGTVPRALKHPITFLIWNGFLLTQKYWQITDPKPIFYGEGLSASGGLSSA